jgi:hypothetical protein
MCNEPTSHSLPGKTKILLRAVFAVNGKVERTGAGGNDDFEAVPLVRRNFETIVYN